MIPASVIDQRSPSANAETVRQFGRSDIVKRIEDACLSPEKRATNVKQRTRPHGTARLFVRGLSTLCFWGVLTLAHGARAAAQSTDIVGDSTRLQGIWRVRSVMSPSPDVRQLLSETLVLIEGDQLWSSFPFGECTFKLNPSKNPKQIDLMPLVQQIDFPEQKATSLEQARFCGIYELDKNRLKLRIDQRGKGARPTDFSMRRAGSEEFALMLEPENSAEIQRKVRETYAVHKIRDARVKAFIQTIEGGLKTLCVQFNSEQGDAQLAEIVPYLKKVNLATDLQVVGTRVTDRGLAALEGVNCLRLIDLEGTTTTDAGIDHLKKLNHLGLLIVSDTRVTTAGLERLGQSLPALKVTHFTRAQSASLKAIREVGGVFYSDPNDRVLQVVFANLNLNDAKLRRLQEHLDVWKSTLRAIDLTNCPISDDGLKSLANLTALEQLNLSGTDVTVAGVKALKRTLRDLKIRH
jgi:uncharacterized protein (TIGR03067 family)